MNAHIDPETIVVINLDHCVDTMQAFRARNAHLGPVRRFSAVVGADADRAALRAGGMIADGLDYVNGALGCALSHLTLWRQIADGTRAVTVCEDDAVFAANFLTTANARLAALPDGWDIVLWGWNFDSTLVCQILPGQPAFLMHQAGLPTVDAFAAIATANAPATPQLFRLNRACGTLGYTISPKGAARLLTFCTPLRPMPLYVQEAAAAWPNSGIDMMMSVFYPRLEAYVSVPPLAISPNVVAHSTTRLVVSSGLNQRIARLSLTALVAEIGDIGASPHTEVELYRSWILANEGSDLVHAAWYNLGSAFVRAGDYDSAIIAFQNVLVLNPGFAPAARALRLLSPQAA